VAYVALFFALTGVAVGLPGKKTVRNDDIVANAIRTRHLKAGAVTGAKLKADAVTAAKIGAGAVGGSEVVESSLGEVPAAQFATSAQNAVALGGFPAVAFPRYGALIPSGTTVTGAFGAVAADADDGGDGLAFAVDYVGYPLPAPVAPIAVNFAPGTDPGDDDATCNGSPAAPTAPAGKVCLYLTDSICVNGTANGFAIQGSGARFGFRAECNGVVSTISTASLEGVWAYHAP
jgi:hypothetical protein